MRPSTTAIDMSATVAALLAGQARGAGPARTHARTPAQPRKNMVTANRAIKPTRVNPRVRRTP